MSICSYYSFLGFVFLANNIVAVALAILCFFPSHVARIEKTILCAYLFRCYSFQSTALFSYLLKHSNSLHTGAHISNRSYHSSVYLIDGTVNQHNYWVMIVAIENPWIGKVRSDWKRIMKSQQWIKSSLLRDGTSCEVSDWWCATSRLRMHAATFSSVF